MSISLLLLFFCFNSLKNTFASIITAPGIVHSGSDVALHLFAAENRLKVNN